MQAQVPQSLQQFANADYTHVADDAFVAGQTNDAFTSLVNQFANFVRDIHQKYPMSFITLDGWSLGGAVAQLVGYFAKLQTVTFNSPGVDDFISTFQVALSSLANLHIGTPSSTIVEYRKQYEFVSTVGDHIGDVITVLDPNGLKTAGDFTASHMIVPLEQLLVGQPETPGELGSGESPGIHFEFSPGSLVRPIASTFDAATGWVQQWQANQQAGIEARWDPLPGYEYSLVFDPTSPDVTSVRVPIAGDIAGWLLKYFTDAGAEGELFSNDGLFSLVPDGSRLDLIPLDASGQPVFNADIFFIGITTDADDIVTAQLTTAESPLATNPPPSSVPEPGSLALLGIAAGAFALSRRRRPAWQDPIRTEPSRRRP